MKRNILSKIYTIAITLAFVLGEIVVFLAQGDDSIGMAFVLVGILLSFILAPTVHELGHIVFAKHEKMQIQYAKFFCFFKAFFFAL